MWPLVEVGVALLEEMSLGVGLDVLEAQVRLSLSLSLPLLCLSLSLCLQTIPVHQSSAECSTQQ